LEKKNEILSLDGFVSSFKNFGCALIGAVFKCAYKLRWHKVLVRMNILMKNK